MYRTYIYEDDVWSCIAEYGKIIIHGQSTTAFILLHVHRTVGMRAHLTRNLMQVCRAGRSCDASGILKLLSNRHKGALLSWSPSAAKSWGRSHLREPQHSRLSRGHESHCKWDTLFLDCANRPSLRLVDTYPIFDAINTRTIQYEHSCDRHRF